MGHNMTLTLTAYAGITAPAQNEINADFLSVYSAQLDTSEATQRTYTACVKKFLCWLEETETESVCYDTLVNYKRHLKTMYKAKALNTHITALKDFFKFLERKGFKNYAKDLKKERTGAGFSRDSLTADQVTGILNSIETGTEAGARSYALFRLLVCTGLRECEVVRANIGDIRNLGASTVLYVQGKGETEKGAYVILYPKTLKALQDYFKHRHDLTAESPLFASTSDRNAGQRLTTRSVQRIIKGLYADNGIVSDRITTHSTRHTAITQCILNGASVQEAQSMARHKDINTTMGYFHNINRLENNAESRLEQIF